MYKKLQLNYFHCFLLLGLLFVGGLSFSEEATEVGGKGNPSLQEEGIEEHDTQDLEKLLKRYNKDQEKVLEDTTKIHTIQENEAHSEVREVEIEEMRPSDVLEQATKESAKRINEYHAQKKEEILKANSSYSESVRAALLPLQKLSEEELLKRLDEATKDSAIRPYMNQFPNITLFTVRLIKDKESIPSAVKIVENKDRLITFASVMLFTIVFGFILKKIMHREGRSFIKAAFYFLIRVYLIFAIRIGIVYYFYGKELTPAAEIFKKTFL